MTSVFPKTFFVQFKGISKLDSNTEHSSKLFSGNVMWQLKIKKTYEVEEKWLGVYLELFAPELNDASSYKVKFSIALLDATQENEIEKCSEESVFSKSKTSYGFDHFIEWDKLTEAGNDYVKCDAIFLKITLHEVHDAALNAVFSVKQFRELVHNTPLDAISDPETKELIRKIQRVFLHLQSSDKVVDHAQILGADQSSSTISKVLEEFHKHIVAVVESASPMCQIKSTAFTRHQNRDWYDMNYITTSSYLNLDISDCPNVFSALRKLTEPLKLKSDDKAIRVGEKFIQLPPVLSIVLTGEEAEMSSYFEYYEKLDMKVYTKELEDEKTKYELYAVMRQQNGNACIFINPDCKGVWLKFNDERVSLSEKKDAIDGNYYMQYLKNNDDKRARHPLTLIYVRESDFELVFKEIAWSDIPEEL